MTYQTAYKLLVAAYKSAKGIMPEGIDLLKLKMKARQKVIDSTKGKILQFPKERITDWTKARPQPPKIEMKDGIQTTRGLGDLFKRQMEKIGQKAKQESKPKSKKLEDAMESFFGFKPRRETEAEMLKRMNRQNKESVARLKEKKEKFLGEKLKDYDGDPDAMAGGGKVKKPFRSKVVDFLGGPSVVGAELGLSGLLEVYNLLGMPLMKDGGKVKKKRKHDDNIDEEDIGEGKSKERFLNKMPRPRNYPNLSEEEIILDKMPRPKRSDGIISLANGGLTNISDTYDNNPTLQAQYPNKQDYLDLFAQQTTTTTPQTNTATQSTTSTIAPINPIKPIIPLPQDSGDSGGGILNNIGRTNMNQPNAMGGKEPGIVAALQRTLGDVKTAGKEIYSLLSPMQMAKRTMDSINNMRAKQAAEIIEQIRREEEARLQAQLNRPRVPGGTIDSGNQGSGGYGGTGGEGPSAVGSSGMLGGGV